MQAGSKQESWLAVPGIDRPSELSSDEYDNALFSEGAVLILILCLSILSSIYVAVLTSFILVRRDMQPLKIKSPRLMVLSMFANLLIVVSVSIIQLSEERCVNEQLIKVTALSVGIVTLIYLTTALCLLYIPEQSEIFKLPSIDTASFTAGLADETDAVKLQDSFNHGMTVSLYFLIFYSFAEGIIFMVAIHRVRNFNEDFSVMEEMKKYAVVWLFFTNLILFLMVQGSYAGFLSLMMINRFKTVLYIFRSLAAVSICAIPPLRESYKDASFFPIPPNRESIESVDMVLHIPVAIDFFYEYLKNRHNPDGIHAFALYIDLRLYDGICLEETSTLEEIVEMAQKIKLEYLDHDAEYLVELDYNLMQTFNEKYQIIEQLAGRSHSDEANDLANSSHNFDLIFIEVYAFVLDRLRDYFELFKRSYAFVELENEIRKKERLYEILVDANLISNQ